MLHKIKGELHGKDVLARDGTIGSVDDVYFDDQRWAVRYLVVDTGDWLPGRRVLISPASLAEEQPPGDHVQVELTREQVRNSPSEDQVMPVSRQFEEAYAHYYGYPFYWDGPFLWGRVQRPISGSAPVTAPPGEGGGERTRELKEAEEKARRSHLRSDKEVLGYRVVAKDGTIGHIDDFLLDDRDWAINGLVIDTRDWLPGKRVTVSPEAVREVDWATREVRVNTTRDEIEHAPKAP